MQATAAGCALEGGRGDAPGRLEAVLGLGGSGEQQLAELPGVLEALAR